MFPQRFVGCHSRLSSAIVGRRTRTGTSFLAVAADGQTDGTVGSGLPSLPNLLVAFADRIKHNLREGQPRSALSPIFGCRFAQAAQTLATFIPNNMAAGGSAFKTREHRLTSPVAEGNGVISYGQG